MLGLFGNMGAEGLEKHLYSLWKEKDWAELSRACYGLGVDAMEQGRLNEAVLWLHRADTIYSASDEVYEQVGEAIVNDCSDRIGVLEDAPLLYNGVPAEVEEKAETLGGAQIRVWGLLSIARLASLGERLGRIPGCEALGKLGWAVDVMLKSLQMPISQEEYGELFELCDSFYQLDGQEAFYGGEAVEVPGGAPFQVFDLNGMMGVHLELNGYLDNHLRLLSALSQDRETPPAESSMVGCTLLPDYYVRTGAGRLEDVPQIQAELARIWDDYDFVRSGVTWAQVAERVEAYKSLDILQP